MANKRICYERTSINLILIVFYITVYAVATLKVGGTQIASSDACFTHIFVTNGKDKIDLIDGGAAKVYSLQAPIWVNFTILNENCTINGFNYANNAIDLLDEADRIELIFRMPAFIGLALACILVVIIIYVLIKR